MSAADDSADATALLQVEQVSRSFGGVFAVKDVSVTVPSGQLRAIIGPNGAGKSTLFNLISGHLRPDRGTIAYRGTPLGRRQAHQRAAAGIAIVFQGARIFRGMTALDNVMVGAHGHTRQGFLSGALRLPAQRREEREIRERAAEALDRVGLSGWAHRPAESLPIGQQRQLQVARALCARPSLLLLDEPASGLRAAEREALALLIEQLHTEGLTMLLIEHDVTFVTRLADRITVLDLGEVIAEGTPGEISGDDRVIRAYLGGTPAGGSDE